MKWEKEYQKFGQMSRRNLTTVENVTRRRWYGEEIRKYRSMGMYDTLRT